MTAFQLFSMIVILAVALAGGYYPLVRHDLARRAEGLPKGQAFAAGVFLALALAMMLPAGLHQFGQAFPEVDFPLASLGTIGAFLAMLAISHWSAWRDSGDVASGAGTSVVTPIIMTVMIAIPSFLLGTAIGVSQSAAAVMILLAILAHKGSAGFALALSMVRSRLSRPQALMLFCLFAIATPLGVVLGADLQHHLAKQEMLIFKAVVMSLAAGVFLFMATLHELRHAPLIVNCCTPLGFTLMLAGLLLTLGVRMLIGLAHTGQMHPA